MIEHKVILLLSGGLDSTLLFRMAKTFQLRPYCILIDYNQIHKQELEFAVAICKEENTPYQIVHLEIDVASKLTTEDLYETKDVQPYKGVSPWHVPSRNLMFVAIAASIAESLNVDEIWYGANYDDRENLFPDCYQEWVYEVNKLLEMNGSKKITLRAPLLGLNKKVIEFLCDVFNVNKTKVFSGYGQ
jgi:7-cyano-7-deazaguanine synthase